MAGACGVCGASFRSGDAVSTQQPFPFIWVLSHVGPDERWESVCLAPHRYDQDWIRGNESWIGVVRLSMRDIKHLECI